MSDDNRTINKPGGSAEPTYNRIVLKLSGESFQGAQGFGIDAETVHSIARDVKEVYDLRVQMAIIVGGGNIEAAIDVLRKKGQAAAQKKATRQATEGLIGHYIHAGGKIGVLIEVNCESDFVARTEDFQRLCHDVAMHIAALDTRYVRREEVTQEILDREREIYKAQARATGKPEPVIEKIVNGKMEKFYEENCLYEQHFIKDESVTVGELVSQMIHKLGENISIRRYVRFKVGEGAAAPAEPSAVAAPAS